MHRQILIVTALSLFLVNCKSGNGAAQIGAPCTPSPEQHDAFSGFKITADTIETNAAECGGGVCLVNHFQGRVSCPLGQPAPTDAQGLQGCIPAVENSQGSCSDGYDCVQAGSRSPACGHLSGSEADDFCAGTGAGSTCGDSGYCECSQDADCLGVTDSVVSCDPGTHQCVIFACHKTGDCQQAGADPRDNAGKACCLPGTDTPVTTPVCGQCTGQDDQATRDADNAVYCTCRCGAADGDDSDPDYPFCACPSGYECSEIRPNLDLGDPSITGKYCIRQGTAYDSNQDQCGSVDGFWSSGGDGVKCAGVGSGRCQIADGPCD